MKVLDNIGLKLKLVGINSIIIAILLAVLSFNSYIGQKSTMLKAADSEVTTLGNIITHNSDLIMNIQLSVKDSAEKILKMLLVKKNIAKLSIRLINSKKDWITVGSSSKFSYTKQLTFDIKDDSGKKIATLTIVYGLDKIKAQVSKVLKNNILWGLVLFILSGIIVYLTAESIRTRISKITNILKELSEGEGDLTKRLDVVGKDEISYLATNFNKFMNNLHTLVSKVFNNSQEINNSKNEIIELMNTLNYELNEEANKTVSTASGVERMAETSENVANDSSEGAQFINEVAKISSEGKNIVLNSLNEIKKVNDITKGLAEKISNLYLEAEGIRDIVNVINDVADQTNLLALNAAIEAARAGEVGRGFAVVADEIRKLAEKTTSATKEIAEKIERINNEITSSKQSMETVEAQLNTSVEASQQTEESFLQIADNIEKLSEMITRIASAADELNLTAKEVAGTIDGMASGIQKVTENSEITKEKTENFGVLTTELIELVKKFKL